MIEFDRERLASRIKSKFDGGVTELISWWPEERCPDRSTFTRWLNGSHPPGNAHYLLCLAATLDLDPLCLWITRDENFEKVCRKLMKAARRRDWSDLYPALSFLEQLLDPDTDWPPDMAAYYSSGWHLVTVDHEARKKRNFYARLRIRPFSNKITHRDQIWHFAWKGKGTSAQWNPYGYIRLRENRLTLYSYGGLVDSRELQPFSDNFLVETWFGEGSAEFRVASLGNFELLLVDDETTDIYVQFP